MLAASFSTRVVESRSRSWINASVDRVVEFASSLEQCATAGNVSNVFCDNSFWRDIDRYSGDANHGNIKLVQEHKTSAGSEAAGKI